MNKRDCSNCKHCDVDYVFDMELEDEYPVYTCDKGNDTSLDSKCRYFKRDRPWKYKEEDMECDRCKFLDDCDSAVEVTLLTDTRPHYECFDILACKRMNGAM